MRKIITGVLAAVLVIGLSTVAWKASAAEDDATQTGDNAAGDGTALKAALETPKGELKNPYEPSNEEIVAKGKVKFGACAPCHGGTGGGGMGPPLTNQVWNYDGKDDTLFRLIVLGSNCKKSEFEYCIEDVGFKRVKREMIAGAMPGQGQVQKNGPEGAKPTIETPDDAWSVITFIRSINPDSLKGAQ